MKIIDRYMIAHFLKPLSVCGTVFTILVLMGHFFDKMGVFTRFHAHAVDMFLYLVLGIPYWLNIVFPVATLLALMFSLGQLQQRGEIVAMRSAGISSFRLYSPFLAMGLLISLISLVGGMTFLPSLNSKANVIYRVKIKREPLSNTMRDNIVATGWDHRHFTIGALDTKAGIVKDIVMDQFDDQLHLRSTLSAKQGHYQNGQWIYKQGIFIQYEPNGNFRQKSFQEKILTIRERPEDFLYENRAPDDMTHHEIVQRIRHLHELGIPSFREQVALHLQYALPFANVVVILLGIPFALNSMKKGRIQTFAYALGASFLYWGTVSVFKSFGEQGHMLGWVSAWSANFIFGILAVLNLQR